MKVRTVLAGVAAGFAALFLAAGTAGAQPAPPSAQPAPPSAQPAPPSAQPAPTTSEAPGRPGAPNAPRPTEATRPTPPAAKPAGAPGQVVVKPVGGVETGGGSSSPSDTESGVLLGAVALGGTALAVAGGFGALRFRRRHNV